MPKKKNPWGFEELMVLAAFRYCLGRRSYIVGCCVDWLVEYWPVFHQMTRDLIRKELDEEFEKDNKCREHGMEYLPLGHDMDRQQWERVRALWQ